MTKSVVSLSPIPTPVALPNKHREYIDWNQNYGQSFKIVKRPSSVEYVEDSTLIVTPKNKTEWETWNEVSLNSLCKLKKNWELIQKNLSEHKYCEIINFIK